MNADSVGIEIARHQWEQGRRALERAGSGAADSRLLARRVEIVSAELGRRLGQVFTIAELVELYEGADGWSLLLLHDALPEQPGSHASLAADAAFELYSRRASDYTP